MVASSAIKEQKTLVDDGAAAWELMQKTHVLRGLTIIKSNGGCIGYLLEDNTSNITARRRQLGTRLKLLMLSTRIQGGGITLARLASITRGNHLVVACHRDRDRHRRTGARGVGKAGLPSVEQAPTRCSISAGAPG